MLSVVGNQSKRKRSSRIRGNSWSVFHRNSLKYSSDQRVKLDCNGLFLLKIILRELPTTKQTLTTRKYSIEFTESDFSCHFKVNSNNLARRWMCEKDKSLRLSPVHSRILTNATISPALFPRFPVSLPYSFGKRKNECSFTSSLRLRSASCTQDFAILNLRL